MEMSKNATTSLTIQPMIRRGHEILRRRLYLGMLDRDRFAMASA
jgi:hypothetical protein